MIGLGAALISQFSWILYLFGAFLLFTGVKMLMVADHMPNIEDNAVLKFLRRHLRVTDSFHGQKFLVRLPDPKREGQSAVFVTPLFLALILIFIGTKIFAATLGWHVPAAVSLGVTVLLLGGGVAVSLWRTRRPVPQAAE